jgi:hypothetical protein
MKNCYRKISSSVPNKSGIFQPAFFKRFSSCRRIDAHFSLPEVSGIVYFRFLKNSGYFFIAVTHNVILYASGIRSSGIL